ncbi:MAG: ROK family protein [Verrucomicrobia bacterium]|nr:MAG: ROK family protein [Verrucomicrobiota bacterium]
MDYAIGIDLGGTNIKFIATDAKANVIQELCYETEDSSEGMSWAERIAETIDQIETEQRRPAHWIGVSAPGMTDREKRSIVSLPGRLNGLEYLDWTNFLGREETVPVLNDAHAALYGESWCGSASEYKNVIFITLGTGVGGAFSINGQLQSGFLGRAGHFGHTSLNPDLRLDIKNSPGSIEMMIGECTIKERTGGRFNSTKDLVNAYLTGDAGASEIWLRSVYHLACALASFINILDPEVILLGGGISKAESALMDPLKIYMDRVEWRPQGHSVPIKFATLGNRAGALGAARYAMLHSVVPDKEKILVC